VGVNIKEKCWRLQQRLIRWTLFFWKSIAFPCWRAMDRRWDRNTVSLASSVMAVMRRPISWTSSMAKPFHEPAVSTATGQKMCVLSSFIIIKIGWVHKVIVKNILPCFYGPCTQCMCARYLRSFEILFEFESDDSDSIRLESDGLIRNFWNRPHLPSYHKPRSLFNKKTSTVAPL